MRLAVPVALALLIAMSRASAAQTLTVTPASAGPLTVSVAIAGQDPAPVTAGGGTYQLRMRRNRGVGSIVARLAAPLPAGTALSIQLVSPGGSAQSAGMVQLTTAPQPVVTSIANSNTTYPARAITYRFAATAAAGVVAPGSTTVIFELAP